MSIYGTLLWNTDKGKYLLIHICNLSMRNHCETWLLFSFYWYVIFSTAFSFFAPLANYISLKLTLSLSHTADRTEHPSAVLLSLFVTCLSLEGAKWSSKWGASHILWSLQRTADNHGIFHSKPDKTTWSSDAWMGCQSRDKTQFWELIGRDVLMQFSVERGWAVYSMKGRSRFFSPVPK